MITKPTALRTGAIALALAAASACQSSIPSEPASPREVAAPDAASARPASAGLVSAGPASAGPASADPAALAPVAAAPGEVLVQVNGKPVTRAEVNKKIDAFVGPQLATVPAEQRDQWRLARATPLHIAALMNRADIVELLLNAGADPTLRAANGQTPLEVAEQSNATATSALLRARL